MAANKTYRNQLFKRIIDLGKVTTADEVDLVRIWRVETGDEKSITLADLLSSIGGGSKWTDVGVGNIYRNSSVAIGKTTDPLDTLDVAGGILVTATKAFSSGIGARFYKQPEHGTVIQASTGSTNDFALITSGGGLKITIPTGQSNIIFNQFDGSLVGIGNVAPTEKIDTDGTARLRGIASGTGEVVVVDATGVLKKSSEFSTESITGLSITDLGGGATYTFSTDVARVVRLPNRILVQIKLSNINSSGTPTGALRINFSSISGINTNPKGHSITQFTGSNITNIEKRVPYSGFDGSVGVRFPLVDNLASIYSSATFTTGVIHFEIAF